MIGSVDKYCLAKNGWFKVFFRINIMWNAIDVYDIAILSDLSAVRSNRR